MTDTHPQTDAALKNCIASAKTYNSPKAQFPSNPKVKEGSEEQDLLGWEALHMRRWLIKCRNDQKKYDLVKDSLYVRLYEELAGYSPASVLTVLNIGENCSMVNYGTKYSSDLPVLR